MATRYYRVVAYRGARVVIDRVVMGGDRASATRCALLLHRELLHEDLSRQPDVRTETTYVGRTPIEEKP